MPENTTKLRSQFDKYLLDRKRLKVAQCIAFERDRSLSLSCRGFVGAGARGPGSGKIQRAGDDRKGSFSPSSFPSSPARLLFSLPGPRAQSLHEGVRRGLTLSALFSAPAFRAVASVSSFFMVTTNTSVLTGVAGTLVGI